MLVKEISTRSARKLQGFTLIELLVAISVLVVIVTIGIPSFSRVINNNDLVANHNEFISAARLARGSAITQKKQVNLNYVNLAGGWKASVYIPDDDGDEEVRIYERTSSRVIVPADGFNIAFDKMGRTSCSPVCEVVFSIDGRTLKVKVLSSGQIVTEEA